MMSPKEEEALLPVWDGGSGVPQTTEALWREGVQARQAVPERVKE